MTTESLPLETNSPLLTCKCCRKEFTYTKSAKGGRPQVHCSTICADRFRDRTRSYRTVAANTKLQTQYLKIRAHAKRQAFMEGLFIRYARSIAGLDKGLSASQSEALTNSFLFGAGENVIDPYTKKEIKPIYNVFMSFCHDTKKVDPYDRASIIERAGLIDELRSEGIALPPPRKPRAERKSTQKAASAVNSHPAEQEPVVDLTGFDFAAWAHITDLAGNGVDETTAKVGYILGFDPMTVKSPSQLQMWIKGRRVKHPLAEEYVQAYGL